MVRSRRAFTLVELLVVIAIISLLIAMLLPAVQAARESGRRSVCLSNARQFSTAVQSFHANHNSLPPYSGYFPLGAKAMNGGAWGSWYVHLMPFMENPAAQTIAQDVTNSAINKGYFHFASVSTTPPSVGYSWQYICNGDPNDTSYTSNTTSTPRPPIQFNGHSVSQPNANSTTRTCTNGGGNASRKCIGPGNMIDNSSPSPCNSSSTMGSLVGVDNPLVASNAPGVLFCPSDPETQTLYKWSPNDVYPRPTSPDVPTQPYALLNYLANFNAFVPGRGTSTAAMEKAQGFGALTDGTANTVLFAEAHRLCNNLAGTYGARIAVQADGNRHCFGIDSYSTPRPNTYMFQNTPKQANCDNWRVQGMHPGILIVAFADNHARGIKNTITRADTSDADNSSPSHPDPYPLMSSNPPGSWDMILLPGDNGTPSVE